MALIANKEAFEPIVRKAGEQVRSEENALWPDLSTTTKLRLAMQMALRKNLDSDQGEVAPEVTTAVMTVAEKYDERTIVLAIDRAWDTYSKP